MHMTQLVIFDLDGVLLDSESLYKQTNIALFKKLGTDITDEEYNSFIGISGDKMWGYIKKKADLKQSISELRAIEREAKYDGLFKNHLSPNPGLFELLDYIASKNIPCAIASSGLMKNIALILEKLNVRSYFKHIVSGEMPGKGKPDPEIFLLAADHFGATADQCLVIEDSTNGTTAAKAAEMTCVGYINPGSGNQDLSNADLVISSLTDQRLLQLI